MTGDLIAFLTGMIGEPIALVRERPDPGVRGTLVDVLPLADPENPVLVVQAKGCQHSAAFAACTRIKFHFTPTDKDRP